MNGRLAKLRRVQELFIEGKVIALEIGDSTETFWVSKPTAFERDEAIKDARAARSRRSLRFDRDPDDQAVVEDNIGRQDKDSMIESLIGAKGNEFYVKALDELKTQKTWIDKIDVIDRAETADDRDATDADRTLVRELTTEYLQAIQALTEKYSDEYKAELIPQSIDEIRTAYRETWRDMTAFEAFMEARRVTEVYFALRVCEATRVGDGWNHGGCHHLERLLEHRDEVFDLPDALVAATRSAMEELNMTPRDAGNSDAPSTSSGSSERPSAQEDSPASSPTETSLAPAGT